MSRCLPRLPGRLQHPALALTLCAGALSPATAAGHAGTPGQEPSDGGPVCSAPQDPDLARALGDELSQELVTRPNSVAIRVSFPGRGLSCAVDEDVHYDSASLVKVLLMLTAVHGAQQVGRSLTPWEQELMRIMITESDNAATSVLWAALGRTELRNFLDLAGAEDTELGPGSSWGLTALTARDQDRLMALLTDDGEVISDPSYPLRLLGEVREDQRWGVSAGTPSGVSVHLKNGWLARDTGAWRVHSGGIFLGGADGPYRITVLTQEDSTFESGVRTVEDIASIIHGQLAVNG